MCVADMDGLLRPLTTTQRPFPSHDDRTQQQTPLQSMQSAFPYGGVPQSMAAGYSVPSTAGYAVPSTSAPEGMVAGRWGASMQPPSQLSPSWQHALGPPRQLWQPPPTIKGRGIDARRAQQRATESDKKRREQLAAEADHQKAETMKTKPLALELAAFIRTRNTPLFWSEIGQFYASLTDAMSRELIKGAKVASHPKGVQSFVAMHPTLLKVESATETQLSASKGASPDALVAQQGREPTVGLQITVVGWTAVDPKAHVVALKLHDFLYTMGGSASASSLGAFYQALADDTERELVKGAKRVGHAKGISSFVAAHTDLVQLQGEPPTRTLVVASTTRALALKMHAFLQKECGGSMLLSQCLPKFYETLPEEGERELIKAAKLQGTPKGICSFAAAHATLLRLQGSGHEAQLCALGPDGAVLELPCSVEPKPPSRRARKSGGRESELVTMQGHGVEASAAEHGSDAEASARKTPDSNEGELLLLDDAVDAELQVAMEVAVVMDAEA